MPKAVVTQMYGLYFQLYPYPYLKDLNRRDMSLRLLKGTVVLVSTITGSISSSLCKWQFIPCTSWGFLGCACLKFVNVTSSDTV